MSAREEIARRERERAAAKAIAIEHTLAHDAYRRLTRNRAEAIELARIAYPDYADEYYLDPANATKVGYVVARDVRVSERWKPSQHPRPPRRMHAPVTVTTRAERDLALQARMLGDARDLGADA